MDMDVMQRGDIVFYENLMSQHAAMYYGQLNGFHYVIHSILNGSKDAGIKLSLLKLASLETITVFRAHNHALAEKAVDIMQQWLIDGVNFSQPHTALWKRVAALKEHAVTAGNLANYLKFLANRVSFSYFRALKMAARTRYYSPTKNKGMTCIEAVILALQVAVIKDEIHDVIGNSHNPYLHITDKRNYDVANAPKAYQDYHADLRDDEKYHFYSPKAVFKTPTKNEAPSFLAWPKSLPPLLQFSTAVKSNIRLEAKAASPAALKAYLEGASDWDTLGTLMGHKKSRPTSPVTKEEFNNHLKRIYAARRRRKKEYQILKCPTVFNDKNEAGDLQAKLKLWQDSLRAYPAPEGLPHRPKWRL